MNKSIEILKAWVEAANPSPEALEIAKQRAKICSDCIYKKEINNFFLKKMINEEAIMAKYICSACDCPLSKKIFIDKNSDKGKCPKNKWLE